VKPRGQPLYLYEILVPCEWNNGRGVRRRHHQEWDKKVHKIAGGLTIMPVAKGQWVDMVTGALYRDRVIPVRILCTQSNIEDIAEMTIEHYRQLGVMYFRVSEAATIAECTPEQRAKFGAVDNAPGRS
jgi:hypothetical protein